MYSPTVGPRGVAAGWVWGSQRASSEVLVEQAPLQGVLVCEHAGLVLNKLSQRSGDSNDGLLALQGYLAHKK